MSLPLVVQPCAGRAEARHLPAMRPLPASGRWLAALLLAASLVWALAFATPSSAGTATVVARIDLSRQTMTVSVNGMPQYSWPVSTARRGYVTPTGAYRPQRMYRSYFSRKYYNSPMPYSIFFNGGYAIHGSYEVSRLGAPASHGCVRLHPSNAATLYSLVQTYGAGNTLILVTR
ncbi:L,D-transpeptidase [Xanthobacter sp. YC-JY1]|uniref:L,D-transpeptidase n=1 Tax=Xanthobacter sp. YC-JY1 TaxID=2419844 RepID=UPI00352FA509